MSAEQLADLYQVLLWAYLGGALFFFACFGDRIYGGWFQRAFTVAFWPIIVVVIVLALWLEFH